MNHSSTQTPVRPALYRLIDTALGKRHKPSLAEFILSRRAQQPPVPYHQIAQELTRTLESDQIHVTHEFVRRWHIKLREEQQAANPDNAEGNE